MKQLAAVRAGKDKVKGKLMKAQDTLRGITKKRSNTDDEPAGPSQKRQKHN